MPVSDGVPEKIHHSIEILIMVSKGYNKAHYNAGFPDLSIPQKYHLKERGKSRFPPSFTQIAN
jgi:hypothetical protein